MTQSEFTTRYFSVRLCLLPISLIAIFLFTTGCDRTYIAGDNSAGDALDDSVEVARSPETVGTTSVAADKLTNLTSPAPASKKNAAADSTPKEVCQAFMDFLQ